MIQHARSCPKNIDLNAICHCDADGPQWPADMKIRLDTVSDSFVSSNQSAPAMAARSGFTGPFGKLTYDPGRILLPEEVGERLAELAAKARMPLAEYFRELCAVHVFGPDELARLYSARVHGMVTRRMESGERQDG